MLLHDLFISLALFVMILLFWKICCRIGFFRGYSGPGNALTDEEKANFDYQTCLQVRGSKWTRKRRKRRRYRKIGLLGCFSRGHDWRVNIYIFFSHFGSHVSFASFGPAGCPGNSLQTHLGSMKTELSKDDSALDSESTWMTDLLWFLSVLWMSAHVRFMFYVGNGPRDCQRVLASACAVRLMKLDLGTRKGVSCQLELCPHATRTSKPPPSS